MKRILLLSAALSFVASMSFAAVTAQGLVDDYLAQGYTRVEVVTGRTQIKVEAIGPSGKVETIYDTATGTVLKQEAERVTPREARQTGVEIRQRNRDFIKLRRNASTASDDNGSDDSNDDLNDDHGDDGVGHDANDDHGNDGPGHDANDDHGGDDDHGDDDHGGDDDRGDDHSGKGRGNDD